MAERVGFEPTKGYQPLPVFKTGAFNRSATSPNRIFDPFNFAHVAMHRNRCTVTYIPVGHPYGASYAYAALSKFAPGEFV